MVCSKLSKDSFLRIERQSGHEDVDVVMDLLVMTNNTEKIKKSVQRVTGSNTNRIQVIWRLLSYPVS
jgi:hypothetical protein